jgi:ferritin-like metal-binding protein YciE
MSDRNRTLTKALKAAHREEVRAVSFLSTVATKVRNQQLRGTFQQFGSQGMGGVATVEGLLEARGAGTAPMLALTRLRASMQGCVARVRPVRSVVEDTLDRAEARARCLAAAASDARLAGDVEAARSLDGLCEAATSQATWLRDYLR